MDINNLRLTKNDLINAIGGDMVERIDYYSDEEYRLALEREEIARIQREQEQWDELEYWSKRRLEEE